MSRQTQSASYEGDIPPGTSNRGTPVLDPLQEKINRFLAQPIPILQIHPKYADVPLLPERQVKHDFLDTELRGEPGIFLDRYTDVEIAELGQAVLPMISSGFSRSGAAALFVLAYHLRSPGRGYEDYVFEDEEGLQSLSDILYSDFPVQLMDSAGVVKPIVPTANVQHDASVYAFLAASMLRLFTKSASNYVKAWSHIVDGYRRFYGKSVDVRLPTPNETAMKSLSFWFGLERRAKITLYRLLYMGNANTESLGLKEFLYDWHVTYTGMHVVNILLQLCPLLNCSPELILRLINVNENERQVKCLVAVLGLLEDTSGTHARRMWRYGRVFDETFMSHLQTKSCPNLVYMMAEALRMEAPETYGGILQIAQLSDVTDANKMRCIAMAQKLIQTVKRELQQGEEGTSMTKKY